MSRTYERVFTVAVPVGRVWTAFTEPDEIAKWFAPIREIDDDTRQAEPPSGLDLGEIKIQDVERNRLLRYIEPPSNGEVPYTTEVTIVLEEVETGTRITFTAPASTTARSGTPSSTRQPRAATSPSRT